MTGYARVETCIGIGRLRWFSIRRNVVYGLASDLMLVIRMEYLTIDVFLKRRSSYVVFGSSLCIEDLRVIAKQGFADEKIRTHWKER